MNAPYQAIRCADGYITIGAANERLFRAAVRRARPSASGRPTPAFADNASRVRNRDGAGGADRSDHERAAARHWLALFEASDIPCGPINDYAQVFADPQVLAREMVVEADHPTLGRLRTLGSPIKMSATPPDAAPPRAAARRAHRSTSCARQDSHPTRSRRCAERVPSPDVGAASVKGQRRASAAACSNACAIRRRCQSARGLATIWRPTGSPFASTRTGRRSRGSR